MKFLELTLENFLSYRQKQTLPLADQGLVLIRGENTVSSSMDANGVGKTALWDALAWALYGQTLRGLKADDVACRFTSGTCRVAVSVLVDSKRYTIERTRRPAEVSVILHNVMGRWLGRDAEQVIAQVVGFGFRTFCNALVFGQGAFDRFALADQGEQLRMLDEIQGLDFRAALDRAKAWRDGWKTRLVGFQSETAVLIERKVQSTRQVVQLEEAQKEFATRVRDRVEALHIQLSTAQSELKRISDRLIFLSAEQKKALQMQETWTQLKTRRDVADQARRHTEKARLEMDQAARNVSQIEESVRTLLQKGTCPTCRTSLTGRAADVQQAFAPDVDQARKVWEDRYAVHAAAAATENTLRQEIAQREQALPGVSESTVARALADTDPSALRRLSEDCQRHTAECDRVAVALTREQTSVWEGQTVLDDARQMIAHAENTLQENAAQITKAKATVAVAEYWVEAFGDRGIRNLLFDSVAGFLNERLAHHLSVLTGGEARVRMEATTALKTGAVRERLSLQTAWVAGASSYTGGSGGQDRRIDLALFSALQDVAESMSARPFPLKVWDQPDDHLDARGQEIFCQWVSHEARTRGSGFLITHSPDLAGILRPDHVWTVVLDKAGSRVEVA